MGIEVAIGAAIVTAVTGTAQAVYSVVQGERAERDAKRAGRARATELRKEADVERERSRRLLSSQRAAYGAAGVDPNTGTPLLVQAQGVIDSILDRQRILAGARNVERDARSQARAYRAEGIIGGIQGLAQAAKSLSSLDFTPAGERVKPPPSLQG